MKHSVQISNQHHFSCSCFLLIEVFCRLIGQGTVQLSDLLRAGTIKRRIVQLTNPQGVVLEAVLSFSSNKTFFFNYFFFELDETLHNIGIYSTRWIG
mgnify:CR=1 FL=1